MLKRILIAVLVVAVCVGGYYIYEHNNSNAQMGSGNVYSTDTPTTNTDLDGHPVAPTPSRSDAPGTVNTVPVGGSASNQPPTSMKAPIAGGPALTPTPASTTAYSSAGPIPVSDTVAPNPPNGLAFGGTGKFQWYRQGNLTWRVDTANGASCIAFATMDEWHKPIVYSHGCGNA
jgi:hypothetical protein